MAHILGIDALISIHAPGKGATGLLFYQVPCCIDFNPRSREGSDKSTSSSGRRDGYFNPRSREGSDDR